MDKDWMRFEHSGSVSDYLHYRDCVESEALLARDRREEEHNRERLHPADRDGAAGQSYR